MKIKMQILMLVFFSVIHIQIGYTNETCSRVAQVNFQTILVDTNSSKKGEGLRYHLGKDRLALSYLNKYQENSKIKWENAALGTLGTALMLGGALSNSSKTTKKNFIIAGGTMIIVNYLVSKTLEKTNEKNLTKAINDYNKRNLPRIYFSPSLKDSTNKQNTGDQVYIEKEWSF